VTFTLNQDQSKPLKQGKGIFYILTFWVKGNR